MKKLPLFGKQCTLPYADFVVQVNSFFWAEISLRELKQMVKECDKSNEPLIFSLIKEVIARLQGLSLFDTQLSAAYAMYMGKIAELPTGEGKTLAAVMTAVCLGLQGRKVHVLTFNEYLAKRDYHHNKEIFEFCGLTVGLILEKSSAEEKKKGYSCQILYAQAKQIGFDYLENFLCSSMEEVLPVSFDAAIVDEADSVLIDEARIPLVIAGDMGTEFAKAEKIDRIIGGLDQSLFVFNKEKQEFWLTEEGIFFVEKALAIDNLFDGENGELLTFVNGAMEARLLLEKDKDYIVKGKQVLVVDKMTGRVAQNRKFPAILQQAVEIKEKLMDHSMTVIFNSMALEFFFNKYQFLSGMTGTGKGAEKELKTMYDLSVSVIPPHVPCIRNDYEDCIKGTEIEKVDAIMNQIRMCHEKGQPVLVGTQSIKESEKYSRLLMAEGIKHRVLNARNDEKEAEIIADAGKPFQITISTNMAGRGVDIKLWKKSAEAGGLFVVGCGLNESSRIDRQLIGRSGRQGDKGESRFFMCREEALLQKYNYCQPRRAQRYEEGSSAEKRYMLRRYSQIIELQRQSITVYREKLLHKMGDGRKGEALAEVQLTLYFINHHWADYLSTMENIRSGIHLTIIGGLNPIDEYQKSAVLAFAEMEKDIRQDVKAYMSRCRITSEGVNLKEEGLISATSTTTYMIDESVGQFTKLPKWGRSINRDYKSITK